MVKNMKTKTKKLKISMSFHHDTDDQLVTTFEAVRQAINNNKNFPIPAVDMSAFSAQGDALSAAVVAAKDGGRKAVAEKNKQRSASVKMLSKQARYVEEVANNDPTILTSSGFQVQTTAVIPQPLAQPAIEKLVQGVSGQIKVTLPSISGARIYEVHAGALGPSGAAPPSWTTVQVATAKPAVVVNGLTPGTTYAFQVRAFGKTGWTEWSDSVTKMST